MSKLTISQIQKILSIHYGLHGVKCKPLAGELDQNVLVQMPTGDQYIFKAAHEDHPLEHLEMENLAMQHCSGKVDSVELPICIPSLSGEDIVAFEGKSVRLLSWIDGRLWSEVSPHTDHLLIDLGSSLARFQKHLKDFKHDRLNRDFDWDPSSITWVEKLDQNLFQNEEHRNFVGKALKLIRQNQEKLDSLPKENCYLDANDNNIIVGNGDSGIAGFIDFGDILYTHRINELAVALAYTCMQKKNPIESARQVIQGYHKEWKITEEELEVLHSQVLARLIISVSFSAQRHTESIENPYLKISETAAWELIGQWLSVHPRFAEACFRAACGFEPAPNNAKLVSWIKKHHNEFHPVLGDEIEREPVTVFDWSVGSLELGNVDQFHNVPASTQYVFERMTNEGSQIGLGRYNEPRPVYSTDEYARQGNNGPEWRTIHIGIDLFLSAGTPIFAPLDGQVVICHDDRGDKEYGPLLVLQHEYDFGFFYTLYGHNDPELLSHLKVGDFVQKGDRIACIGNYPENGNWVPHSHFQIICDLFDYEIDYPGVAYPSEREIWCSLCPDPNLILGLQHPQLQYKDTERQELISKRRNILGPNLSLSYQSPLHIVRGYKQHLFDEHGRRYLDTVNNVPHVGHQHPRVVKTGQQQMAVLNTNTRYLHDNINIYAERLLKTLPDHLEVIYFTNSGSEANELALRMARRFSGKEGIIALEHGYHGNTGLLVDISSYKFDAKGGDGQKKFVSVIPAPDAIRGYFSAEENKKPGVSKGLMKQAFQSQADDRINAGTFIHETILSCGGQIVPHENYFKELYAVAREEGAVVIADEVQTGLGRVGEKWWAFEIFDLSPDIVTMGKPIGNGHPLGAVATTRKIAESFDNGMEYFNTFAGNPVSCAIGNEVLSVIRDEGLMDHALEMEKLIKMGFEELRNVFSIIGDIRGHGLFLGIELLENQELKIPAANQTKYLLNRMQQHGILISSDGPHHNVLKIKPPMCIQKRDVEQMIETLGKIFREDQMRIQE